MRAARIGRSTLRAAWLLALGAIALVPELAGAAVGQQATGRLTLAYIDPGTGSFLVQALVAAVAGIAVTLKMYWSKIKGFFGGATVATEGDESPDATGRDD